MRLHELEPLREDVRGQAGQAGLEILKAAGAQEKIPHDEERPAIPHHFERLGHRAALPVDLRHGLSLAEALTKKQVTTNLQVMSSVAEGVPQTVVQAVSQAVSMSPRTKRLLEAPVTSTLLRLAAPNVLVMVLQAVVTTMDAVFVGWLGTGALAGVSLVYPLVMLMMTMSAGGMGGGVSSAVARALGAGRRGEAEALAAHAVLIALGMSALFTTGLLLGGPAVYRAMGGTGTALEAALTYSHVMFGGAAVFWLLNTLASIVRGTGTMALPAAVMTASAVG